MGAAADQILDENQLKYFIGLLRDKINKDQRVKNPEFSDIDEDFHGFSSIKPHIHVTEIFPEIVSEIFPETISETVLETVSESVSETTQEAVSEAVPLTITVTFSDTIPADKSRPKNRTRTRRRRKPKWLMNTTTNAGWNTPTGFYYNQTS